MTLNKCCTLHVLFTWPSKILLSASIAIHLIDGQDETENELLE